MFKLILSLLLNISYDGWYPVEKKEADMPSGREQTGPVLFVKKEGERIWTFWCPDEPRYRYAENGDLEVVCMQNGNEVSIGKISPIS